MFERVLVCLDRSDHAKRALQAGLELARLAGAEVRVLHVREGDTAFGHGVPLDLEPDDEAKRLVNDAVQELTDAGLKATGTVHAALSGRVAADIVDEAREWQASVLVLASRGMTDLMGILVGSTTHKVLHLSGLPTLVVH